MKDKIVQISTNATAPNVAETIYGLGESGIVYFCEFNLKAWAKQEWIPILEIPEKGDFSKKEETRAIEDFTSPAKRKKA